MKSFTVIINSSDKIDGTNIDGNYFFDWGLLDDRPYNMYFECNTEPMVGSSTDLAIVFTSNLLNCELFSNVPNFDKSNYIGMMTEFYTSGVIMENALPYRNAPIYLNTRPTINNFFIKLYDFDGNVYNRDFVFTATLRFETI